MRRTDEPTNFEKAFAEGRDAREAAGQELGEDMDCSDYIGDTLCDRGYDGKIIEAVIAKFVEQEGW